MPLILPGNVASAIGAGYEVANSCRFEDGDNPKLIRTQTAGDQRQGTFSAWIKKCSGPYLYLISWNTTTSGTSLGDWIRINDNCLDVIRYTGSVIYRVQTTRVLRDPAAWYHICVGYDSDQATASNRIKVYINGVQQTVLQTTSYPAENLDFNFNDADIVASVGRNYDTEASFDGYMAEVVWIDGTQYAASDFGEFDEDSPTIWKPKDVSGLTFGTNGFYLDFEDGGDLDDDESGESNDLTLSNLAATDQSTDTPTNNIATMNPLNVPAANQPTFKEGNLETESPTTGGQRFCGSSTIGVTAGKWYAECKIIVIDSATVGVSPDVQIHAVDSTYVGSHAHDWSILPETGNKYNDNNGTTHGDAFSANDILMIALDIDNLNVYFGHNGNWFDGDGNADESSPNSALSLTAVGSTPDGAYFFACSDGGGDEKVKLQWNFGSPPYANSSSVADANGYGAFEYAPPSGYLALCTKNLGSDGG